MSATDGPPNAPAPVTTDEALRRALAALKDMRARVKQAERDANEPIAVVGMSCRFPGGISSSTELWDLVNDGRDAVQTIPEQRWDNKQYFDPDPEAVGTTYTDQAGILSDPVDAYDPAFFGIADVEADYVDPQHRLLLEVAWEALEDAAIRADGLVDSATGVFVGISTGDYAKIIDQARGGNVSPYDGNGMSFSMAAGRISNFFGFRGPTLALDTACSSSLVATAQAMDSLRSGSSDLALAGGVNLLLEPTPLLMMCATKALSPSGRCHTFSADADGYVRAEGAGVLVLKRLSDALADNDRIRGVIRAGAVNHDGRSMGLTVPNGPAQSDVIRRALKTAGLGPTDVDYVEAHGTATPLGDPIEVRALNAVYSEGRDVARPLYLGSIKANIGHAEAAAGMAGLIKIISALEHRRLPPHVLRGEISQHLDLERMPIEIPEQGRDWPNYGRPKRAAVSGFGLSGTNAHVIVEQAPERPADDGGSGPLDTGSAATVPPGTKSELLVLSAKSEYSLTALASRYAEVLRARPVDFPKLVATSQVGRSRFPERLAVVSDDPIKMSALLVDFATGQDRSTSAVATGSATAKNRTAFLFGGQRGPQPGVGSGLFESEPVVRDAIVACNELAGHDGPSPVDVLFSGDDPVDDPRYEQPATFAIEYALAQLWRSWGVQPTAVAGHSVGEYAAAVTAGVMELPDAMALVGKRGRLTAALTQAGGTATETMLEDFRSMLAEVALKSPNIPFFSTVTGREEREAFTTADYWVDQLNATARFDDAVTSLGRTSTSLLEIGTHPTLVHRAGAAGVDAAVHVSLDPDVDDGEQLRRAAAGLWTEGAELDWTRLAGPRSLTSAPSYPFQRNRHWRDP